MTKAKSPHEYVFKVWVKGARRVSRTLAFRGDQTLDDLHEAVFQAFDRFDPHLYTFYFPKMIPKRGVRPANVTEYAPPFMLEDPGPFPCPRLLDATKSRLDDIRLHVGQEFEYLFDFGDSWVHEIEVLSIGDVQAGRKYPALLEKKGTSPPQYERVADDEEDASEMAG